MRGSIWQNDPDNIGGVLPTDKAAYLQLAFERQRVLLSGLDENVDNFDSLAISRSLQGFGGARLVFYAIRGSSNTTDTQLKEGINPDNVLLSIEGSSLQLSGSGSLFTFNWAAIGLELEINTAVETFTLGAGLQSLSEKELIDLSSPGLVGQQYTATFTVNREAAFNNFVGFYTVVDTDGGIDTNGDGTADLTPESGDDYIRAALENRLVDINLTVDDQSTATFTATVEGGTILAPFIISDGTVDQALSGEKLSETYFSFLGTSSNNGVDYIRLLGDNTFGFEDQPGGGDNDFDDLIVEVSIA